MTAHHYGYARVSTGQQSLDQQRDALEAAGVDRIFEDTASGARADRPGLLALLDHARTGDAVSVVALDRLGRSTLQVLSTLHDLHERGIVVRSQREQLDLGTPAGRMVAAVFAALAELERELIRERAAAAREAARVRGRQVGRPPALSPEQAALVRRERQAGVSITAIAASLGVSRATVYRYSASEEDEAPV